MIRGWLRWWSCGRRSGRRYRVEFNYMNEDSSASAPSNHDSRGEEVSPVFTLRPVDVPSKNHEDYHDFIPNPYRETESRYVDRPRHPGRQLGLKQTWTDSGQLSLNFGTSNGDEPRRLQARQRRETVADPVEAI